MQKGIFYLLSALAATGCSKVPERPNIILIFADDLGYADLACYGQKLIQTPNLDLMAREGIRLTDFYTACPVSAPSRYGLLTGSHMGDAWVRNNLNVLPTGQLPIKDEEITVAEILKANGYKTAAVGKWSLGSPFNSGDPRKQGFDHFFGYYCQNLAHNFFPDVLWRNGDSVKLRNEIVPVKVNFCEYPLSYSSNKIDFSPDYMIEEALEFIDDNREEPFFLYYATTLPHSNGEAPPDERFEVPDWGIYSDSAWTPVEKGYASMVTILDDHVGRIIQKLKETGISDNTLVIFTSDNGPTNFAAKFKSSGDLRGRKRDLYEAGIREPFIAMWPGEINPGTVSSVPCATFDLLATFCELAGTDVPESSDGNSMVSLLKGDKSELHGSLYFEIYEGPGGPMQAVRKGDWKLIRFGIDNISSSVRELYNLASDPGEKADMAASNPDIVMELTMLLDDYHKPYPNSGLKNE
jgi:arylsulfatase A-like enzyme